MICCTCKVEKEYSCFGKDKYVKGGISHRCKECKNSDTRKWNATHKEQLNAKQLRWKASNPDRYRDRARAYAAANSVSINAYKRGYEKERRSTDPSFRLTKNLRSRLNDVLCGRTKKGSAVSDLGCSVPHLRLHLELFWDEGMTWENYGFGKGKWEHRSHLTVIVIRFIRQESAFESSPFHQPPAYVA